MVFLLFIYALVIVACLKLRGKDETEDTYRANTPLLVVGILGNLAVLAYTLIDDPAALLWVAGLLAVGLVLYLAEKFFGKQTARRQPGAARRRRPRTTGALTHARHRRHRRLPRLAGRAPSSSSGSPTRARSPT